MMKNMVSNIKKVVCFILIVLAYLSMIAGTVCIYKLCHLSITGNRIVQNVSYAVQLVFILVLMKCTHKPFVEFGMTVKKLPRQLLIGAATGGAIAALMFLLGKRPDFSNGVLYILFSQLLVVITEEMFFRGYLLTQAKDIFGTKDRAVIISSIIFALMHIGINLNITQVIFALVVGILFSVIRTEFKDSVGIPALALAHFIINVI